MAIKVNNKLQMKEVQPDFSALDQLAAEYSPIEEQQVLKLAGDLLKNPEQYGFSPEEVADYQDDPFGFNYDFGYAMGANLDTREGNARNFNEWLKANKPDLYKQYGDEAGMYMSDKFIEPLHKSLYEKSRKK
jgi:hypothetical protein